MLYKKSCLDYDTPWQREFVNLPRTNSTSNSSVHSRSSGSSGMGTPHDIDIMIPRTNNDWDFYDNFEKGLTLNTNGNNLNTNGNTLITNSNTLNSNGNSHLRWTKIRQLGAGAFGTVSMVASD